MQRYRPGTALIVVDVQNDFADPAGSLAWPAATPSSRPSTARSRWPTTHGAHRRRDPGLAPGVDPAFRQGRRHLAGPLRRRNVGRGAPPGPGTPRRRAAGPQGRQRRGRLLRLHDARPDDRRDDRRPSSRRSSATRGVDRRRRRRPRDRLLRQGDGPRRRPPRLRDRGPDRRDRAPSTSSRATASGRSTRCSAAGVALWRTVDDR